MSDPIPFRVFTLVNTETGATTGRYKGRNPKQAAAKALSMLHRTQDLNASANTCSRIIVIQEITSDRSPKLFSYQASRIRLSHPSRVRIGNTSVTYSYINRLLKVNLAEDVRNLVIQQTSSIRQIFQKQVFFPVIEGMEISV